MKKIETNTHLSYKTVRDVVVDRSSLYSETIGIDDDGNYILHKSYTVNCGSGYGEESEYYQLSKEEASSYVSDHVQETVWAPKVTSDKNAKHHKKAKKHRY